MSPLVRRRNIISDCFLTTLQSKLKTKLCGIDIGAMRTSLLKLFHYLGCLLVGLFSWQVQNPCLFSLTTHFRWESCALHCSFTFTPQNINKPYIRWKHTQHTFIIETSPQCFLQLWQINITTKVDLYEKWKFCIDF